MELISPDQPWEQAKVELWRDCGSLGKPGTKEKEKNIQNAIFEQGIELV
jgi:hypothetical protein